MELLESKKTFSTYSHWLDKSCDCCEQISLQSCCDVESILGLWAILYSYWLDWPCDCLERIRVQYCSDVESVCLLSNSYMGVLVISVRMNYEYTLAEINISLVQPQIKEHNDFSFMFSRALNVDIRVIYIIYIYPKFSKYSLYVYYIIIYVFSPIYFLSTAQSFLFAVPI